MAKLIDRNSAGSLDSLLGVYRQQKLAHSKQGIRGAGTVEVREPPAHHGSNFTGRISIRLASIFLVIIAFLAVAGFAAFKSALQRAADLRSHLESLKKVSGLAQAVSVDFNISQPNFVQLAVNFDHDLVRSIKTTSDEGETWCELYPAPATAPGFLIPSGETRHEFALPMPQSGERDFAVTVRTEFAPAVIEAFPEYATSEFTDIRGAFRLSSTGITKLIRSEDTGTDEPEISMCLIPMAFETWELDSSTQASADLSNDGDDGALVNSFRLNEVGHYILSRHAIPGSTASDPSASLKKLTVIELELFWDGDSAITLEPRLSDNQNKIIGIAKLIEPSTRWQTLRIPISSLAGYFGISNFDIDHVQRLDIALARKTSFEAASGSIKFRRIELIGTTKLEPFAPQEPLQTIVGLSLEPGFWSPATGFMGGISLSGKQDLLDCKLTLPYDETKGLPWANIETKLPERDLSRLTAIEIDLVWKGSGPITLEPKLATTPEGHTYGRYIRVKPSADIQTVRIYAHDLRYYWSLVPGSAKTATFDRRKLGVFSMGMSLRAYNQSVDGMLSIRAIHLLGTP